VQIVTWNLYHGRSKPPSGRPLLPEFAETLAGWEWDVAMLQEVPPWWPPELARAAGAEHRSVLTSRNSLLWLRKAIASRWPDLVKSQGGGSNAILVRGQILAHAHVRLSRRPERRIAHGIALADGAWVVNLHANTHPHEQTLADGRLALERARAWSAGAPLVFGGDFNQRHPAFAGLPEVAGHWVDHLFTHGLARVGKAEVLEAGTLSDHKPVMVRVS
jgi:endonuclease/exonuclease/phosphatase family metal-dependent hydrolase